MLGVTVEVFRPLDVLERGGWRCYLCGEATPQELRGSTDLSAPEVDHIVPLARGGSHSMLNAACACRGCNLAKRERMLAFRVMIAKFSANAA
jgi:5-methylcytosine-specific restriction endonuclease McrA